MNPESDLPGDTGKTCTRRVTAKDVAQRAGVSTMTVSRALNDRGNVDQHTRSRVIEAARMLGYIPNSIAKSLVLNRTRTIGVVVPEITHSFFPEAIRGIEEAVSGAGYHLILTHSAEDASKEREALLTLEEKCVDGILISSAQTIMDYQLYEQAMSLGIPLVFFDRCVFGIGATCVRIDDEQCAQQITAHLVNHGYTSIAHLSGPQRISIGSARQRGYLRALTEHNLACPPELIVESGLQESGGYDAMLHLLGLPEERVPRAVVAVNDPVAFGAMKAIEDEGLRIPEDVAIVGFSDDIRAALMPAPLTTVRQPAYAVGKLSAQKLLSMIEDNTTCVEDIVVQSEQVIRRSCGCSFELTSSRGAQTL